MYEKHLKRVHLSRLSPGMWGWKQGYPRKELGVPIQPAYGMGVDAAQVPYNDVTGVRPGGNPMWENLYRIGVAGKLSRVAPFGPDAFTNCTNCGVGDDNGGGGASNALGGLWPFLVAFLGFGAITYLGNRYRG